MQCLPGGKRCSRNATGVEERQAGGLMRKPVGGCHGLSRVATDYAYETEYLIPHNKPLDIFANRCNGTGNLDPRRIGQRQWDELLHCP